MSDETIQKQAPDPANAPQTPPPGADPSDATPQSLQMPSATPRKRAARSQIRTVTYSRGLVDKVLRMECNVCLEEFNAIQANTGRICMIQVCEWNWQTGECVLELVPDRGVIEIQQEGQPAEEVPE